MNEMMSSKMMPPLLAVHNDITKVSEIRPKPTNHTCGTHQFTNKNIRKLKTTDPEAQRINWRPINKARSRELELDSLLADDTSVFGGQGTS